MTFPPESTPAERQVLQARNVAFAARRAEYAMAWKAVVGPYEYATDCPGPEVLAYREAEARWGRARDARDAAERALALHIDTLEKERRDLLAAPVEGVAELAAAAARVHQLHEEKVQSLKAAFPDIEGVYSAGEWESKIQHLRENAAG